MIVSTVGRVPSNTPESINEHIRVQTAANVARYASSGAAAITQRLAELDREWDIERTLETNASAISLVGLALGATVSRKWFLLPLGVSAFLLQHAIQGWCPPLPILRQLGVRTASEIDEERVALKALRGDFRDVASHENSVTRANNALAAARA